MWQHWTNFVLGLVVIVVAFLNLSGVTLAWTLGIIGVIIALIGLSGGVMEGESERSVRHA